MLTLAAAADFASSLSLLAILAWGTTLARARLPDEVVGLFYGLLVLMQMHAPIEVEPGVIVDLRAVTIALAAVLLRPGGVITCLTIAIAARLQIGGVGAYSGVAVVLSTAVLAGIWTSQMATRSARPGPLALIGLALFVSLNIGTAAMLPAPIAIRFLTDVAPFLVATNVVTIPILAWIGLRDPRALLGRDTWLDKASGMLTPSGLRRAWAHRRSADLPSRGTGLTLMRLRHGRWTARTFGGATLDASMGALRARLETVLPREVMIARPGPSTLAILWPDIDEVGHRAVSMGIVRTAAERAVVVDEGYRLAVPVESGRAWQRIDADLDALLAEAEAEIRAADRPPALPQAAAA